MSEHIDPALVTEPLRRTVEVLAAGERSSAEQLDGATESLAWTLRAVKELALVLVCALRLAEADGVFTLEDSIAGEDLKVLKDRLHGVAAMAREQEALLDRAWSLASPASLRCAPRLES